MSAIKIEISRPHNPNYAGIPRTEVWVDGSFAYQTPTYPELEGINLKKLFDLMFLENIEIRVIT